LSFFKGKKRDYLDSSYFCVVGNREYLFSKVKLKIFSPLEEEDQPGGAKMYIAESIVNLFFPPLEGGNKGGGMDREQIS